MQNVYLISCKIGCQTLYKIGVAVDVDARLAQLQTGNPVQLTVEDVYEFDNAEIVEKAIHQAFKKERLRLAILKTIRLPKIW